MLVCTVAMIITKRFFKHVLYFGALLDELIVHWYLEPPHSFSSLGLSVRKVILEDAAYIWRTLMLLCWLNLHWRFCGLFQEWENAKVSVHVHVHSAVPADAQPQLCLCLQCMFCTDLTPAPLVQWLPRYSAKIRPFLAAQLCKVA